MIFMIAGDSGREIPVSLYFLPKPSAQQLLAPNRGSISRRAEPGNSFPCLHPGMVG